MALILSLYYLHLALCVYYGGSWGGIARYVFRVPGPLQWYHSRADLIWPDSLFKASGGYE
jgi:hypothetical protein